MTSRRRMLVLATVLLAASAATAQDFFRAVSPDLRASDDGWGPTRVAARLGAPVDPTASALDRPGRVTVAGGEGPTVTDCQFDRGCGDGVFAYGTTSVQFLAGTYFSGRPGPRVPSFSYIPVSVRFGWMATDPTDHWWGRGNFEWICDTTGAAIISDYGHWFAGQSYLLRFNFVEPGATVVPYNQLGAGWVLNDAYRDQTQKPIGAFFEFYLHYEVGVHCFVAPNLSLDVEGGIQHISNGNTAGRNLGVNAFGGAIGFTYYFPAGR
ncbi:MAG TPA: acyloxyacyl hydrolase [Gemmataceae bacterium]|nr:acyloxyacyl hydrolase [Gemmataceae bacterium]